MHHRLCVHEWWSICMMSAEISIIYRTAVKEAEGNYSLRPKNLVSSSILIFLFLWVCVSNVAWAGFDNKNRGRNFYVTFAKKHRSGFDYIQLSACENNVHFLHALMSTLMKYYTFSTYLFTKIFYKIWIIAKWQKVFSRNYD